MAITQPQIQDVQAGIDNAKRLADLATRQNAADIAAGQKQTYQTQSVGTPAGTPLIATGTVSSPATITATSLAPTASIDYKTPNPPQPESMAGITAPPIIPLTPVETQADELTQRLVKINESLLGKTAFSQEQQKNQGIPEKNQAIADLTQQFNDLQKKEAAIKIEYGGSLAAQHGVLEPFVSGERDARLRQNAVEALTISSSIDAANGLLASAQRKVDLAVQQKYGAQEEELKVKLQNLEILSKSPGMTRAEKDRAAAQALALRNQELVVQQKIQDQKDIWNLSNVATQNIQNFKPTEQYPTASVAIQAMRNAKTKEAAQQIQIETGLTKPPAALSDFEQAFLRDKGRLPTVTELQASKATEKVPPADIQSFKAFFPNVDIATPAGRKTYLDWQAKITGAKKQPEIISSPSDVRYLADQVYTRKISLRGNALNKEEKQAVLKDLNARGLAVPRDLTAKEQAAIDDAVSGLSAVERLQTMADKGTMPLYRADYLPGVLSRITGASQFLNDVGEATDIKTRIRTGAALNESEISFYRNQAPKAGDRPEDVQQKLAQLRGFYLGMSGLPVTVTNPAKPTEHFAFDDLFTPQQRLGLRRAIDAGFIIEY